MQLQDLKSADVKKRLSLAHDSKTNREILYYLAEKDPSDEVRLAVAKNPAMPVQVSPALSMDRNDDVRLALAARLVDLLPGLSQDKHSQLYAFAVQSLGTLALDEVLKIRVALSSTLKDHAHTPPKVAGQLARDIEREVSEPILRFCAALSDQDLLDILSQHPAGWVIQAVAGRSSVSGPVSEAVIRTDDRPSGQILLENAGAQIGESLLQIIVEKAKNYPEWQKPMALRQSLPASIARSLAEFVDSSVRDLLLRRGDFDEQDSEEIAAVFRRRMDYASDDARATENPRTRLERLVKEGELNEETLTDAIAMRDRDFVMLALGHMARISRGDVERVFALKAPKPVIALSWKAGLGMRTAFQLQKDVAQIPPKELVYPRGGTDYPLTEEEIRWQLEFLGLKAA